MMKTPFVCVALSGSKNIASLLVFALVLSVHE